GLVVHQTALYDLILSLVLLGTLLWLRRKPRYDAFLITFFGAWYSVQRIIEDFLREDVRHFGLTGSQWTSVFFLVLCVWHLTFVRRTPRWGRWDEGAGKPPPPPSVGGEPESEELPKWT